jgi:hypothetical protein
MREEKDYKRKMAIEKGDGMREEGWNERRGME